MVDRKARSTFYTSTRSTFRRWASSSEYLHAVRRTRSAASARSSYSVASRPQAAAYLRIDTSRSLRFWSLSLGLGVTMAHAVLNGVSSATAKAHRGGGDPGHDRVESSVPVAAAPEAPVGAGPDQQRHDAVGPGGGVAVVRVAHPHRSSHVEALTRSASARSS